MTSRSGRIIQDINWYSPEDTRRSKRSKSVPTTPSSVRSSRSRSASKRPSKNEQLEETPSRQSFSGTPSSGDDFDRLYNDMRVRGELESIKAEQEQKNGKLTEELNQWKEGFKKIFEERLMTLCESIQAQNDERLKTLEERLDKGIGDALADERLKTLEEVVVDIIATADIAMAVDERLMILEEEIKRCNDNVSSLESKLNPIRAFGLAVIVLGLASIVLFLIQAYWTFLTHGIDTLVSIAGICIDFVASVAALFKEFVVSMAARFRDYLVSKAANAVTSAAEVSGSKIGIRIVQSEM